VFFFLSSFGFGFTNVSWKNPHLLPLFLQKNCRSDAPDHRLTNFNHCFYDYPSSQSTKPTNNKHGQIQTSETTSES